MTTLWRDGVVTALTLALAILSGCPTVGCATVPAGSAAHGQEIGTGTAARDVGPGARVTTLTVPSLGDVAAAGVLVVLTAAAALLLWKHDPNTNRTTSPAIVAATHACDLGPRRAPESRP